MSIRLKTIGGGLLLAILALMLASVAAVASLSLAADKAHATHAWNGYHWARTANPFPVNLGDNVTPDWDGYLSVASGDWTQSSVLDAPVVAGSGNPTCPFIIGRAEVCNGAYGRTGWLGLASIQVDANQHIYTAKTQVNDTYLNATSGRLKKYNKPAWRQFVMCQEVGHDFGLAHQDENFYNYNLGSCMDYTNDPNGGAKYGPSNLHPNQHDYDELEIIYAHLDSYNTNASVAVHQVDVTKASRRGTLVHKSGAEAVYVRSFEDGTKVITTITFA